MPEGQYYPKDPVLIAGIDESLYNKLRMMLTESGIEKIKQCQEINELRSALQSNKYSFILLNISMPYISATEINKVIKDYPIIPVILVSDDSSLQRAIDYMKQGIFYYYQYHKGAINIAKLSGQILDGIKLYEIIKPLFTNGHKMRPVFTEIWKIAQKDTAVILIGKNNEIKERVAEAIHNLRGIPGKFVRMKASGLADSNFNDSLLEEAQGGTVFIDEIGDLTENSHAKLIRLLREGIYFKSGYKADFRIIAATTKNIEHDIQYGKAEESIFLKLKFSPIKIPTLKQ
ncbi:MAG: sigma 54-interacting transcriptional regulator [Candidatus Omnitrophota bacterium]